jgi:protein-tyrosine phosphatase
VTGQSFLGRFGRQAQRFAEELVNHGIAHFVASDAHGTEDRTTRLDEAFRWFEKKFGRSLAEQVFIENPRAAIEGLPVAPQTALPVKKKWVFF